MTILTLETSAKSASVAITRDHKLLLHFFHNTGLTHSRTLLKMTEDLLRCGNMSMADIDVVAVANGPGSFTGIRIGVSAAIGLAIGVGCPVCGVSTLEAMAYLPEIDKRIICPVMDARREQVYTASFMNTSGALTRLTADRAMSMDELANEAAQADLRYLLLGDGSEMCYNHFQRRNIDCYLAPQQLRYQNAWGVACAAQHASHTSPEELAPNYIRLSQAERERLEKNK